LEGERNELTEFVEGLKDKATEALPDIHIKDKMGSPVPNAVTQTLGKGSSFISNKLADGRAAIEASKSFVGDIGDGIDFGGVGGIRVSELAKNVGSNFADKFKQLASKVDEKIAEVDVEGMIVDRVSELTAGTAVAYKKGFMDFFEENKANPNIVELSHAHGLKNAATKLQETKGGIKAEIMNMQISKEDARERVECFVNDNITEMKRMVRAEAKETAHRCAGDVLERLKSDPTYVGIKAAVGGESACIQRVENSVDAVVEIAVDAIFEICCHPRKAGEIAREARSDMKKSGEELLKGLSMDALDAVREAIDSFVGEGGGEMFPASMDPDVIDRVQAACGEMIVHQKDAFTLFVEEKLFTAVGAYEAEFNAVLEVNGFDLGKANLCGFQAAAVVLQPETVKEELVGELKSTEEDFMVKKVNELKEWIKEVVHREIRKKIREDLIPAIMASMDLGEELTSVVKIATKIAAKAMTKISDDVIERTFEFANRKMQDVAKVLQEKQKVLVGQCPISV